MIVFNFRMGKQIKQARIPGTCVDDTCFCFNSLFKNNCAWFVTVPSLVGARLMNLCKRKCGRLDERLRRK